VTGLLRLRRIRRAWLWVALLAIIAASFVGFAVDRLSTGSGPSTMPPAPVMSQTELAGNLSLGRDCGYSTPLPADPGTSLWLFCDTPVYARRTSTGHSNWDLQRFIAGSTAAFAATVAGTSPASRKPGTLSEVRTPRVLLPGAGRGALPAGGRGAPDAASISTAPEPFLSAPTELFTSAGLPCGLDNGSYPVSWISGVAPVPSSPYLLISFNDYCVLGQSGGGFLPEGFGLVEYDPATGTLSNDATVYYGTDGTLSAAPVPLGSPVFAGGYLYLFGATCSAPVRGQCGGTMLEARVAASPQVWSDPLSYQWAAAGAPNSWTSDPFAAAAMIPGPKPDGLSVTSFQTGGRGIVAIEQTDIRGSFAVYQAQAPDGTWSDVRSGRVDCRVGPGYANFCRALIAHPELSTPTQLVLSYFDPAAAPEGHVMVQGFTW
jgi:hypothetical protein